MFPPANPYAERRRAELEQQLLERRLALRARYDCDEEGASARLFSWVAHFAHAFAPRHERPQTRYATGCMPVVTR